MPGMKGKCEAVEVYFNRLVLTILKEMLAMFAILPAFQDRTLLYKKDASSEQQKCFLSNHVVFSTVNTISTTAVNSIDALSATFLLSCICSQCHLTKPHIKYNYTTSANTNPYKSLNAHLSLF